MSNFQRFFVHFWYFYIPFVGWFLHFWGHFVHFSEVSVTFFKIYFFNKKNPRFPRTTREATRMTCEHGPFQQMCPVPLSGCPCPVSLLTGTHLGVPFRLNFALRVWCSPAGMAQVVDFGHFLWITHVTLFWEPSSGPRAIPAKVDVVLEIVIRAVPGAFVRVSLSSVVLLTGTHLGVLSD